MSAEPRTLWPHRLYQIEQEAKRAEAIVSVADQITWNADLQLKAAKLIANHGAQVLPHLPMIGKSE